MRLILLLVVLSQFLKLHHNAEINEKKWYLACTEEAQNMKNELPKLLNIERGKLARGERSYIVKPGEHAKYEPAANMEESKWSHESRFIAEHSMNAHLNGKFDDLYNSVYRSTMRYRLSARLAKNGTSCENAWMDYVESEDRQRISLNSLRHVGNRVLYLDEARTEAFKSISNITDIGCVQYANDDHDIMTVCAHGQLKDSKIGELYRRGAACSGCPNHLVCNSLKLCSPAPTTTSTTEATTTSSSTSSTRRETTPSTTAPFTTPSPTTRIETPQALVTTNATTTAEDLLIESVTNETIVLFKNVTDLITPSQSETVSTTQKLTTTTEIPIYVEQDYDYQDYEYVELDHSTTTSSKPKSTHRPLTTSTTKPSTKKVTSPKPRAPLTRKPTTNLPLPKPSEMKSKSAKNYIIVFILVLVLAIIVFIVLHCMRMRRA